MQEGTKMKKSFLNLAFHQLGGGHRYSWILLDTVFFGYLANFWDPSIQKKHVFTPNFLTLGTHKGRGLGVNSLLL